LAKCFQPDISFSVHKSIWHCENPTISDWRRVLNIFKYLKNTNNFRLLYNGQGKNHSKKNTDFSGDKEDRKSTCHIILMGNSPICLCSKKQNTLSTSTAEAEYMSTSEC